MFYGLFEAFCTFRGRGVFWQTIKDRGYIVGFKMCIPSSSSMRCRETGDMGNMYTL